MTRRKIVAAGVLVVVVAAVTSGSLIAAAGPKNPLVFVLRPPDFPTKADPVDAGLMPASFRRKLGGIGAVGRGAQYFASIPFGPERFQTVSGLVVTTPSVAEARKVYAWQKRTRLRATRGASPLRLRRFGDEQVASSNGESDSGQLLVRKNTVVWRIEIGADGELVLPPARVRDELEKYAATQQARVGKG